MRKIRTIVLMVLGLGLAVIAAQIRPDLDVNELKNKYAGPASKFLMMPGVAVHYREEGRGPALVLLHGSGASLHTWEGWAQALQDDFRVVRMDLPGFGLTGPDGTHDFSMNHYVEFLSAFLDSLGIPSCHLAGNSLGGRIAWHFALAHRERLQSLILVDAAGYPTPREPSAFKLARNPFTRVIVRWITPRRLVQKSLLEVYGDDSKVTDDLVQRYYDLTRRAGNRLAYIERANTIYQENLAEIAQIMTATLVLWGAEDEWEPVANARRFDADLPRSELRIYAGVGHVPMEEIPERTAQDVKKFLLATAAP